MRDIKTFLAGAMLAASTLTVAAHAAPPAATEPACPPAGTDITQLQALKAADFAIANDSHREQMALALLACLADPNPFLRDDISFEAYTTWLRGNKLSLTTRQHMMTQLLGAMVQPDSTGLRRPFAALVLSELARADRISPFLSAAERQNLLDTATNYLQTQRDYRGFDDSQGWRHGIAHCADLLMQLALNRALDKAQLDQILAAISSQIAPSSGHFYIYGEPDRLARPVLMVAMRGLHKDWPDWFKQVAAPAPLPNWNAAFKSQQGLAKKHNTQAFLLTMFANAQGSKNAEIAKLLPAISAALAVLP